jgi:predicted RNA-binding Zn-ribbon protein involved in translation (DUF1610 family)
MKRKILVHPMLPTLIQAGITNLDGHLYASLDTCPACGGEIAGYDTKRRFFTTLHEPGGERDIFVSVKRYRCRACGLVSPAKAPIYPDTRIGAPVVDLCVTLSQEMNYSRAARVINALGIVIDRGTVRNYDSHGFAVPPATEFFGFRLPVSIISLTMFTPGSFQAGPVAGAEPLIPISRPATGRAFPYRPPVEEGHERDE